MQFNRCEVSDCIEENQRISELTKRVVSWCAANVAEGWNGEINECTRFDRIRAEWESRYILFYAINPWVREELGIKDFYADEIGLRATVGSVAACLAAKIPASEEGCAEVSGSEEESTIGDSYDIFRELDFYMDAIGEDPFWRPPPDAAFKPIEEPTSLILGCPRSGTTLFRTMLGGHSLLNAPPELHLIGFKSLRSRERWFLDVQRRTGVDRQWLLWGLVQTLAAQMGMNEARAFAYVTRLTQKDLPIDKVVRLIHATSPKPILIEKSPSTSRILSVLPHSEYLFRSPRYLFLFRHPGAVIESLNRMAGSPGFDLSKGDPLGYEEVWCLCNGSIIEFLEKVDSGRQLWVRYEDLVEDPETEMRRVCAFLDVAFEPAMLDPFSGGRNFKEIGDPNLASRKQIEKSLAQAWRGRFGDFKFGAKAVSLAKRLGYDIEPSMRRDEA